MTRETDQTSLQQSGKTLHRPAGGSFVLRPPTDRDGRAVHDLVARSGGLDTNSLYANLLQCTHFANTSILAEDNCGKIAGFASGYRLPDQADTLFIWQVATDPEFRGIGLGISMLEGLLSKLLPQGVRFLEATISPGNEASFALFSKLFTQFGTAVDRRVLFSGETHFGGKHDDEILYHAGPFDLSTSNKKEES